MSSIQVTDTDSKNSVSIDILVLEESAEKSFPVYSSRARKILEQLKTNFQLVGIVVSIILGFIIGIAIHDAVQRSTGPSTEEIVMYIKFPGDIFIRLLRMIILPLTISSIIVALGEIDTKSAGKLGKRTFLYYFITTIFACILGVVLVKIIKPGEATLKEKGDETSNPLSPLDSFLDLIRNLCPENLVEAAIKSTQTTYNEKLVDFKYEKQNISVYNKSAETMSAFLKENIVLPWHSGSQEILTISNKVLYNYGGTVKKNGSNVMGLIVFSIALGIIIQKLNNDGRPLLDFFNSLLKAILMLVSAIMWLSPLGILSLIAGSLAEVEDILSTFRAVGLYVVTIVIGIFIQSFLIYPLLYFLLVRKNPFEFLSGLLPALITAFGTSSSSATLPVTIRCVTEKNKVDRHVSMFVLPIGATCNMDGSAIYFAVTVIFIANLESIKLSFGELVLTVLVSVFVSAGATGIPSAGLSYTILCLEAVGLPTRYIGLIFAIDWMVDRLQTVNNVMGDAYGAGLISHISKDVTDQRNILYQNGTIHDDNLNLNNETGDYTVDTRL